MKETTGDPPMDCSYDKEREREREGEKEQVEVKRNLDSNNGTD